MIFLDTETDPFAPGRQFPRIVCGQFGRGDRAVLVSGDEVPALVRSAIDAGETFCGHTIAFDLGVTCAADPTLIGPVFDLYEAGRVLDVAVTQKLLDISTGERSRREYSLDALSRRYGFGALDKGEDGWRTRFGELRGVPVDQWPERARAYALEDVLVLPKIRKAQEACDYAGVLEDERRQAGYAFWLKLASGWGIMTDPQGVASFEAAIRAEHARLGEHLRRVGFLRPDRVLRTGPRKGTVVPGTRDTKAVKARMQARIAHLSPDELQRGGYLTASGGVSTNKKVCKEVDDPDLEAYAEFSSLVKTLSTDIPLLSQRPIHTFFDSLKETGRIGSSNPNITNLPRKEGVRECFVPRPGCCFVSADYSGIELYTWAEVCLARLDESTLADELRAGTDPHLTIASEIIGKPYDWCKANKKAPEVDLARQTGKVLNFGCPGGIGAERLAFAAKNQYGVDLSVERAKELRDLWWAVRTEMRAYSRYIASITDSGGVLEHLYSGRYRGDISYTEACNSLFQGLASDIAKSAGFLVARACYADPTSTLYGCRIVNFVHDELILEVPLGREHEAAAELVRLMNQSAAMWLRKVPIPKIEADAMMRWSKKVVPLFVEGRLVPWVRSLGGGRHVGIVNGRETEVSA